MEEKGEDATRTPGTGYFLYGNNLCKCCNVVSHARIQYSAYVIASISGNNTLGLGFERTDLYRRLFYSLDMFCLLFTY